MTSFKNPLRNAEYYRALRQFHKSHPGALEPVFGSPEWVRLETKKAQTSF